MATVSAGFRSPDGGDVFTAGATVTWDGDLKVTVSDVRYSTSVSCKWRVKNSVTNSIVAGYNDSGYIGDTFTATEGTTYIFQACVSGPGAWGNSTDGSSHFTVTRDSGGGGSSGGSSYPCGNIYISKGTGVKSLIIKRISSEWGGLRVMDNGDQIWYDDVFEVLVEADDGYELDLYTLTNASGTHEGLPFCGTNIGIRSIYNGYIYIELLDKGNITIYATAKPVGRVHIDNGTTLEAYMIYIDNGISWEQYIPYIDNGSGWDMYN